MLQLLRVKIEDIDIVLHINTDEPMSTELECLYGRRSFRFEYSEYPLLTKDVYLALAELRIIGSSSQ